MVNYKTISDAELEALCIKHGVTADNVDLIVLNIEVELRYEFDSIEVVFCGSSIKSFPLSQEEQAQDYMLSYLGEYQISALELDRRCYNERIQHDRKAY
jgi:hypothetical protein